MRTIIALASILALNTASVVADEHKNTLVGTESAASSSVVDEDANIPVTGALKGVSRGAASIKNKSMQVKVDYLKNKDGKTVPVKVQDPMAIKGTATNKSKMPKSAGGGQSPITGTNLAKYSNMNEDLGKGSRALLCGTGNNLTVRSPLTGRTAPTQRQDRSTVEFTGFTYPNSNSNVNIAQAQGGEQNINVMSFTSEEVFAFFGITKRDYYAVPIGENPNNGVRPTALLYRNTGKRVQGCNEVVILGGGSGGAGGGGPQPKLGSQPVNDTV